MSDRFDLIARKQEIRRQIERVRRQLERERAQPPPLHAQHVDELETQLEQLMAEEYNLRLKIDRSKI